MSDNIIQLDEDLIKNNLKDLVHSSVEETLNALLDHEADELVNLRKIIDTIQNEIEKAKKYRADYMDRKESYNE